MVESVVKVKGRSFKGSLSAREELGAIAPEKEVQEEAKSDLHVVDEKAAEPKAKPEAKPRAKAEKVEPKAAPEKSVVKDKISVAIAPADLALLRKAAKKAGKSVSLFAAECIADRVR